MGRTDRTYWTHPDINRPGGVKRGVMCEQVPRRFAGRTGAPEKEKAPLVASRLEDGRHSPVLDLDYEATLLPSTNRGHYHLYLDGLELPWWKYRVLLYVLAWAGVIQKGFYKWSVHRRMSTLRRPGVRKPRYFRPVWDRDLAGWIRSEWHSSEVW